MEDGGRYGNESTPSLRTIPAEVEDRPFKEGPRFQFNVDDYNEYFLNQMYEILTEYGPISEVWLDGAHPRRKGGQLYDYTAWRELIRTLAPDAAVFGREDIRWCGNEAGATRSQEWNVITYSENPDSMSVYHDITDDILGTRDVLMSTPRPYYLHYQPAETDTSIRDGWFWRNDNEQAVRTPEDIFDIYERTVGGNSIFLLNIPPNTDGMFSNRDSEALRTAGAWIRDTYGKSLLDRGSGPKEVLDMDEDSYIKADMISIQTRTEITFNRIMLQEPVHLTGERVESFCIEVWNGSSWECIHQGNNIGRKRIVRFDPVTTDRIRIRVLESRAEPAISSISVHNFTSRDSADRQLTQ